MEHRIAKVNISHAGGTASKEARTAKLTIPTKWLDSLSLDDSREVELSFDGERVVVTKRLSAKEFFVRKTSAKHDVKVFLYYDGDIPCSVICCDFSDMTLAVENYVADPILLPFGVNTLPTWDDFMSFLEERCIPRHRAGIRPYLDSIGVGEYQPLEIIRKTSGRMAEDKQWLKEANEWPSN